MNSASSLNRKATADATVFFCCGCRGLGKKLHIKFALGGIQRKLLTVNAIGRANQAAVGIQGQTDDIVQRQYTYVLFALQGLGPGRIEQKKNTDQKYPTISFIISTWSSSSMLLSFLNNNIWANVMIYDQEKWYKSTFLGILRFRGNCVGSETNSFEIVTSLGMLNCFYRWFKKRF